LKFFIIFNKLLFSRISVEEALRHPYMADYHLPEDEPTAEQPFDIEDNNDTAKTLAEWRGGKFLDFKREIDSIIKSISEILKNLKF
jgi:hypothetical protein